MKKRYKIAFLALIGAVLLGATLVKQMDPIHATDSPSFSTGLEDRIKYYSSLSEEELKSALQKATAKELVEDIDYLSKKYGDAAIMYHAQALYRWRESYSDQDLLSFIKGDHWSRGLRGVMVFLYTDRYPWEADRQVELKKLLIDPSVDIDTKQSILTAATFGPDEIPFLKKIIEEDNGHLSFYGLKQLGSVDPVEACKLAKAILHQKSSTSELKRSGAQKVLSYRGSKILDHEEKRQWIKSFMEDFEDPAASDFFKDSSIYALSDLRDEKAILSILSRSDVDRELKVLAIDQNCMELQSILAENPTNAEIQLIIEAMEILPLKDLYDPLTKALKKCSDPAIVEKGVEILKVIQTEGIFSNQKWNAK